MNINIDIPNCIVINNKFYKIVDTKPDSDDIIRSCAHCDISKQCDYFRDCIIHLFQRDAHGKHFKEFKINTNLNITLNT